MLTASGRRGRGMGSCLGAWKGSGDQLRNAVTILNTTDVYTTIVKMVNFYGMCILPQLKIFFRDDWVAQ